MITRLLSGWIDRPAFASSRLAARSALALLYGEVADMLPYQRAVDRELQPELIVARRLQELFHVAPPPYLGLLERSQKFWRGFCYLIRGELTYLDFMSISGQARFAIDFLSAAARRRREAKVVAGKRLLASSTA